MLSTEDIALRCAAHACVANRGGIAVIDCAAEAPGAGGVCSLSHVMRSLSRGKTFAHHCSYQIQQREAAKCWAGYKQRKKRKGGKKRD